MQQKKNTNALWKTGLYLISLAHPMHFQYETEADKIYPHFSAGFE